MSDEVYYKDRVRELEQVNSFAKSNTLYSVINKLEWIKENGGNIDHAIEAVKAMLPSR